MIEANEPTSGTVVKQETPTQITTTMIINDLENGISREDIKTKYGLETWEVVQMFQHPTLKGKKAKKVRKLSFEFVDDTLKDTSEPQFSEREEQVEVDPNQVTLEQVIEEANDEVKANWDEHTRVEEGIDHKGGDDEVEIPTVEDTMKLVQDQQTEEFGESFDDEDDNDFEY
jgi:hypothetical protein